MSESSRSGCKLADSDISLNHYFSSALQQQSGNEKEARCRNVTEDAGGLINGAKEFWIEIKRHQDLSLTLHLIIIIYSQFDLQVPPSVTLVTMVKSRQAGEIIQLM